MQWHVWVHSEGWWYCRPGTIEAPDQMEALRLAGGRWTEWGGERIVTRPDHDPNQWARGLMGWISGGDCPDYVAEQLDD